jgi:hypothetical protein
MEVSRVMLLKQQKVESHQTECSGPDSQMQAVGPVVLPKRTATGRRVNSDQEKLLISPKLAMKLVAVLTLTAAAFATTVLLHAQVLSPSPQPSATAAPVTTYEPLPTLDASVILQPQYFHGPNFTVRNAMPTYSGSNRELMKSIPLTTAFASPAVTLFATILLGVTLLGANAAESASEEESQTEKLGQGSAKLCCQSHQRSFREQLQFRDPPDSVPSFWPAQEGLTQSIPPMKSCLNLKQTDRL